MPEKIYMVLRDTARKGRDIGIYHMQHEYADSGVQRLQKLTAVPGGWRTFTRAAKMPNGDLWVSMASLGTSASDIVWYPLKSIDWDAVRADDDRAQQMLRWSQGRE